MRNKVLIIALTGVVFALFIGFNNNPLPVVGDCINDVLSQQQINTIEVITKGPQGVPVLRGELEQSNKTELITAIRHDCSVSEIQDFIKVKVNIPQKHAELNVQIDTYNKIIKVTGNVHDDEERQAIISNLANAATEYSVAHLINIDKSVSKSQMPEHVSLLLAATGNIKYADIDIGSDKIILRGLVRDEIREQQTMNQMKQLFDQFEIQNKLDLAIETNIEIRNLQFEKPKIPKLEK